MGKKVFMAIGNSNLENIVYDIEEIDVVDSESDLNVCVDLVEFIEADFIIINRLLDDIKGTSLKAIAEKVKKRDIKIILLLENYNNFDEKKLITSLVNKGVYSFIRIKDFSEEKVMQTIKKYPEEFNFEMLVTEKKKETIIKLTEAPKDYKKIIGVSGISNSGKSTISLYTALTLAKNYKVALSDLSENQDFTFYYGEENFKNNKLQITNNLTLFQKDSEINEEDPLLFIDTLKEKYDAIVVDLGNSLDNNFCRYIDSFYIVCDNDLSNVKEINCCLNKMKELNIHPKKIKLVFNKIFIEQPVKTMSELSRYDMSKDMQEIYDEDFEYFIVSFILDKESYDKAINFDEKLLKNDNFKNDIFKIASDMYYMPKLQEKRSLTEKLFRRRGKKKNE